MRLSEAIRLGSMLKPQGFGVLDMGGASCALGAACNALGIELSEFEWMYSLRLHELYPELLNAATPCVCCGYRGVGARMVSRWVLEDAITHLNDTHHWTREQIADWVETIENSVQAAAAPIPEEVTQ